ncbi:TonB-dependent receptor domain-containing protein [Aquabacterium sp.]|uniref:TonB-dependent receptor domain-containing protein n=1 Tax=Aquabacterium sp. TaxID=1872578 RepID=UPI002CED8280|nr:TonB-dependent receptor [Aquabacterium sp.]HSW03243.1 TonB-dependent receptor [Aquabacterium sp.]
MPHHSLAHRAAPLVAALGAIFAGPSLADEAQTVVVTAGRTSQALTNTLPHTTVLNRTDIELSQAVDLAALLATEAGVQLSSNGPRGTATSLFLRGAQARQVLVLVDGVPLSRQDATGQIGIEHLMLDQVDRIEIVRGNASALYGAGAIGGVIQVFTRSASATPQASVRIEGGSRGLVHGSAQATQRWGATHASFGVSGERDRGYSALDAQQLPAVNADRDGYRNTSAALNLGHALSAEHSLAAGWVHSDGKLDYDSRFSAPTDTQRSRTRKDLAHLSSENSLTAAWSSRVRLSSQREDTFDDTSGDFGYHAAYRTTVDSLNWDNSVKVSPTLLVNGGLDYQRQRITADDGFGGGYQHARSLRAVFGGARASIGAHDLALNLRHDDVDQIGSRSSGSLAWGWQFAPAWKATAQVANAFGVAPLGYLYAPYFGNPELKPELSRTAELGLQWATANQRLRATLFRTRVIDEIEYDNATFAFANVARTRNQGLELSYNGRIGNTDLRGSLTSQRAIDDVTGARRLRRSDVLGSLAVSHDLGQGWRVGLALRHAGDRPDSGGVTLPAYTVGDVTAQWDMSRDLQWFARIENVADVHYQTAQYYNQPARGVFAGLRWRLPL